MAAVLADAPSSLRRYSPDHTSIDPSIRNADRTISAGTRSFGVRNNAEIENSVCVPSTCRSLGTADDVQTEVTASAMPAYANPTRKSISAARSAPATDAPVMPPSAYVACIHCRTGLFVRASDRWAATFMYTSTRPFPTPRSANVTRMASVGR